MKTDELKMTRELSQIETDQVSGGGLCPCCTSKKPINPKSAIQNQVYTDDCGGWGNPWL